MTHLEHLQKKIPDLLQRRTLDLGSCWGRFLKPAQEAGIDIVGLEINPEKAGKTKATLGSAEDCPFPSSSFQFINVSEVIEHVQAPVKVLKEIKRLLTPEGICYMSVPSR